MRYDLRAFGLSLLLLAIPAAALAQSDMVQVAKNHFDDGQNFYLQGKYAEAADHFLKAYTAKPYPAFIFNVAVCHEKSNNYAEALKNYERFLREAPHSRDKKLVEQRIASIRAMIGSGQTSQPSSMPTTSLPPIQTKGLVVIESAPEGAALYLNSKKNGMFTRTPYTGSLPPGRHTIIVELKDYRTERKTFIVRNDRLSYLYFGLSVEKTLGWVEVKANIPGANVYLDRKEIGAVGRTPYSSNQRPGKRKIIVEARGYEPVVKEVNIVAGKAHVVDVQLERVKYGWLRVTGRTTRGAAVKLDGKPVKCSDYPCYTKINAGTHLVEVEKDGHKTYEHNIEVSAAEEVKLAVRLEPKPPRVKAYITLGVSAVLLGGGIVAGVMSKNRADSLQSDLDSNRLYDTGDSRFFEGKLTAIIANSLFGLAGITAGLGLYYLFRNEGPDSYGEATNKKIAITPAFGPNMAALQAQLRF